MKSEVKYKHIFIWDVSLKAILSQLLSVSVVVFIKHYVSIFYNFIVYQQWCCQQPNDLFYTAKNHLVVFSCMHF